VRGECRPPIRIPGDHEDGVVAGDGAEYGRQCRLVEYGREELRRARRTRTALGVLLLVVLLLGSAVIGNFIEWYDFTLYGYLAVVIAPL